jgi:hypothetical protein
MWRILEVRLWDSLRWHDVHTKFHDDWLRNLSNIKVINSTIWEVVVLVLLMWEICVVRRWDSLRWHEIRIKFHKDRHRCPKVVMRHTDTHRQQGDLINLLFCFKIKWAKKTLLRKKEKEAPFSDRTLEYSSGQECICSQFSPMSLGTATKMFIILRFNVHILHKQKEMSVMKINCK